MKRRYRVHVATRCGNAHVRLVRWRWTISDYITVANISLTDDDAEERVADARARAGDLARSVNLIERKRL